MTNIGDFFTGGHFDVGSEDRFPWDCDGRSVWYALFTTAGARGFSSSLTDKRALIDALEAHRVEGKSPMLIGVWTSQYYTSLFPLDGRIATDRLRTFLNQHEKDKTARADRHKAQRDADRIRNEESRSAKKRADKRIAEAQASSALGTITIPARATVEQMRAALMRPGTKEP